MSFRLNEGPRAREVLRWWEDGLVAATETRVGRGGVGGLGGLGGCRSRRGAETGRRNVEKYSALDDRPVRWGFHFDICVTSQSDIAWTTFKPKRK